jgi:hypothetical protein
MNTALAVLGVLFLFNIKRSVQTKQFTNMNKTFSFLGVTTAHNFQAG